MIGYLCYIIDMGFNMKNTIKLFGLLVFLTIIGFSLTACKGEDEEEQNISITISEISGNQYNGWEAYIALYITQGATLAYGMPLNVTSSTTSLTFSMLNFSDNASFIKSGTFNIIFWFKKTGEEDVTFLKLNHSVSEGTNTIKLSSFTSL